MCSISYSPSYFKENKDKMVRKVLSKKYPTPEFSKLKYRQAIKKWEGSYERLSSIRCPSLVIGGEKDVRSPPENSRILAKQIPGAELVIIKNGSHHLIEEKKDQFITTILDFLGKINLRRD
jgi:aminoacrylate hydrolase